MLKGFLGRVVGGSNDREIRKLQPLVDAINELEPQMEERTDAQLRALTDQFRRRLDTGETLDDLLVEAFATVREVAKRTVDMRPFDVQLVGGVGFLARYGSQSWVGIPLVCRIVEVGRLLSA